MLKVEDMKALHENHNITWHSGYHSADILQQYSRQ